VEPRSVREGTEAAASEPVPSTHQGRVRNHPAAASGVEPMMRTDPTALLPSLAGLEELDCPACATGWHSRCCHPDLADDGDGELVERCCDGLLIARRRRPLWTR
jgi:hypothetical protein